MSKLVEGLQNIPFYVFVEFGSEHLLKAVESNPDFFSLNESLLRYGKFNQ